ncbi:cation diffusion facilitator family transporter [Fibrobacterota bacterium]
MLNNSHRPHLAHDGNGHDHDHDHGDGHSHDYKSLDRKKLIWSMAITASVMVLEIAGGIISNSIALLSDAGHMFTHFFALLISYIAIRLAAQEPCHHRTFGLFRAEVLASLLNGIFLLGVTGLIVYESMVRLLNPEPVASREMFVVAFIGLVVNIITILILQGSKRSDRNIKAAFMHMAADAFSSIGVVAGAVIIHLTGFVQVDALLGLFISLLILFWAWGLIKDSVRVLLEIAPKGMETDKIKKVLMNNDKRILEITDMHVVEITSGMYNLSASLTVSTDSLEVTREIIKSANHTLAEVFNIRHSTFEPVAGTSREDQ